MLVFPLPYIGFPSYLRHLPTTLFATHHMCFRRNEGRDANRMSSPAMTVPSNELLHTPSTHRHTFGLCYVVVTTTPSLTRCLINIYG